MAINDWMQGENALGTLSIPSRHKQPDLTEEERARRDLLEDFKSGFIDKETLQEELRALK